MIETAGALRRCGYQVTCAIVESTWSCRNGGSLNVGFKPLALVWRVETTFAQLGRWRRLSRCFEGSAESARASPALPRIAATAPDSQLWLIDYTSCLFDSVGLERDPVDPGL